MTPIKNYNVYQNGMKKSLDDKLFFLDLIDAVDTLVDFGCADGQLLKRIHEERPEWGLMGIDMDEKMIDQAQKNCPDAKYINTKGIYKYPYYNNCSILNLSSVIHEIYSYCTMEEIHRFWDDLFNSNYKYISIRDMALSEEAYRTSNYEDLINIHKKANKHMLNEFERINSNIKYNNSLIHFLMKYRYVQNWDREVRENYFPITVEQLLYNIDFNKYNVVYFEHYVLPFTKEKVKEDFGIELKDATHFKLLLERK